MFHCIPRTLRGSRLDVSAVVLFLPRTSQRDFIHCVHSVTSAVCFCFQLISQRCSIQFAWLVVCKQLSWILLWGTRPRQMVAPPGAGIGSGVATPEGALNINDLVCVDRPGSAPPAPGYVGRYEPLPLERIDPIRQPPYPSLKTSPSVPQSMPPVSKN